MCMGWYQRCITVALKRCAALTWATMERSAEGWGSSPRGNLQREIGALIQSRRGTRLYLYLCPG